MITFAAKHTTFLAASVASFALVASACGSTSTVAGSGSAGGTAGEVSVATGAVPADTVPIGSADVTPADADVDAAADVTPADPGPAFDAALTSRQFLPANSPALPCDEYVDAVALPVGPCERGPLVEDVQTALNDSGYFLEVDGFYGEATFAAVQDYQSFLGMFDTGYVDDVLAEFIFVDE